MISKFNVTNFLSIRSTVTLNFVASNTESKYEKENVIKMKDGTRILKAATIYGKNATGKSNIVKAIAYFNKLVTEVPASADSKLLRMPFAFDQATRNMTTEMSVEFYIRGIRYFMSIGFINEYIIDEMLIAYLSNRPTCLYHRKYDPRQNKPEVTHSSKAGLTKNSWGIIISNTPNNCSIMAAFGKSIVEKCLLTDVYEYLSKSFAGVFTSVRSLSDYAKKILASDTSGKALEFLHDMFKHIKYDVDISFNKAANELIFGYNRNGYDLALPEEYESKGIIRFLGMSALLQSQLSSSTMVIIDGLDNELHPYLRSFFFQSFLENCRNASQFLFTTHSFYLLDRDFVRRDIVNIADMGNDSSTNLQRLSEMNAKKYRNLYNAYKAGKLISHPKLTKFEVDSKKYDFDIMNDNYEQW